MFPTIWIFRLLTNDPAALQKMVYLVKGKSGTLRKHDGIPCTAWGLCLSLKPQFCGRKWKQVPVVWSCRLAVSARLRRMLAYCLIYHLSLHGLSVCSFCSVYNVFTPSLLALQMGSKTAAAHALKLQSTKLFLCWSVEKVEEAQIPL